MAETTTAANPVMPPTPEAIHNCPSCSHWLPEGTLVCPDCGTIVYSQYLGRLAYEAQQLEQQQKWTEALAMWRSAATWLPPETSQGQTLTTHIGQLEARLAREEDQKQRWRKRLGPFAPIALFLLKAKSFLFILFKLKFLISMLAFFGLYWAMFGWRFALGFTFALLVHEMGHYFAVRRRGLKADMPFFLPGMGAYVRWYGAGVSREDLASIALAGPLWGLVIGLIYMAVWLLFRSPVFAVLAYFTAWVNFINLFPLLGLDGAQATYALSRMQRALVAATCLIFFLLTFNVNDPLSPNTHWIFLIVALGMGWRCLGADAPEKPSTASFAYFQALTIALGLVVLYTYPTLMQLTQ